MTIKELSEFVDYVEKLQRENNLLKAREEIFIAERKSIIEALKQGRVNEIIDYFE